MSYELTSPSAEQDDFDGSQDDHQIHPDRHILDIEQVVIKLFDGIFNRGAVSVVDLGPSGNARPNREAFTVIRDLLLKVFYKKISLRPRAYKAHFAFEYIPELRDLIDADLADDAPDPGDALIVVLGPYRTAELFSIGNH